MSYKDKEVNVEMDDLKIKSHLNASLDLSGINVSEDLINRTLAAIKLQSAVNIEARSGAGADEKTIEKKERKVLPWNRYVRGIAGIAAAAVIAVIGINFVRNMPMGMKMDKSAENSALQMDGGSYGISSKSAMDDSTMSDTESADAPMQEESGSDMKEIYGDVTEAPVQFTIAAEAYGGEESNGNEYKSDALAGGGDTTAEEEDQRKEESTRASQFALSQEEPESEAAKNQDQALTARITGESVMYSFREIFIPSPEQVRYLTISDDINQVSVTLTSREDVEAFYLVMYGHQFGLSDTSSPENSDYTVEMNSSELGMLYIMEVGSNLTVRYTQGDTETETVYYAVEDTRFRRELTEFFTEFSN